MEHCASAPDVNACVESQCAITEPQWAVEPTGIRYSRADGILHVDVAVAHQAGRVGTQEMTHEAEAWLGVTVLKGDGSDLDLAVQTVIPDQIGDSFVFAAEVGDDVEDIIFGLWGTKIEPCDVDRSGCRNFGFVLDTSLAAWPPDTYTAQPPRRQRILEQAPTVLIQGAGAPHAAVVSTEQSLQAALQQQLERFGLTAPTIDVGPAIVHQASGVEVIHRHPHDGPLASALAVGVDGSSVREDAQAEADIVVRVGGPEATMACMQTQCDGKTDTDWLACLAACP